MRSAAQIVAYEIAMGFALVGVFMASRSLNLGDIIAGSAGRGAELVLVAVVTSVPSCTFISGVAETNRAPFDVAEGESEIVAGFHVEYSGAAFAMFFLGEYANMILISALTAVMFLGGWLSPFEGISFLEGTCSGCAGFALAGRSRPVSSCSASSGSAQRSRVIATTRSCGWVGKSLSP